MSSLKYKKKIEIEIIAEMAAYVITVARKISPIKPQYRSLCSANNEPTEFLSVDNLTKYVKDLTMTNTLKKSKSYFQTKYNRVPINTQTIKGKSQERYIYNILFKIVMGDNLPTIFMNSKNSHLIKLLEMIPGDNIEFENNILIKHNAKNPNFSPDQKAEIQVILNEMLNKTIIRETIHASTEFVLPIFIVKKPDGQSR